MNKYVFVGVFLAVSVLVSFWVYDRLHFRASLQEKAKTIEGLQEKLAKCTSNQIVFNEKVKKSDLNLRQFLSLIKPDTCQTDTASIVAWWDNLKPRERRKYRKENL
ncbi:MAG: hypothetical protein Fur0027_07270 [Raineya sp.]